MPEDALKIGIFRHINIEPMMQDDDFPSKVDERESTWISLENAEAVEQWLDDRNRELQQLVGRRMSAGQGICLSLSLGGECFLHTNSDGDILLDVTKEAAWVTPVIAAATQTEPPKGSVWLLPNNVLAQLVLGLDSLIQSSRLVLTHSYKSR